MEKLMFILELIGVAAFSIAGTMTAMLRKADVFGVIFAAVITALGGGVIRDVLLGQLPPKMFTNYTYILVATVASIIVFIDAYARKDKYRRSADKLDKINNFFDAVGLAVFTVSGMNMAIECGAMGNPILVIALGVTTGIGGGMLRDMMLGVMVKVLRKRVYAVASLAGGIIYYLLLALSVSNIVSAVAAMTVIFVLRVLATVYEWNLPAVQL